jgi:predicted O-methyltransferase YrrM
MEHFNENFIGWFTWPRLYKDMVNKLPSGSKIVEVGTYEGKSFAYLIVEMVNAGKRFQITGVDSFTFPDLYNKFNRNMKPVKELFDTIVDQSWNAPQKFDDGSLDFVFIDADHVYENVKKDILAWMPKIKKGGIIAGHDFVNIHPGVIQAVCEIFGERNIDTSYLDEICWLKQL